MKKFLFKILFIVIVVLLSGPVNEKINLYIEDKHIEESKPTQEERLNFQNLVNDNTYYYYNNLNETEKEAYVTMYSSFMNFEDSFVLKIESEKLKTVFTAVLYDNPHIFWVANDYQYVENNTSVTFTPNYRQTQAEAQQITTLLNKKIDEIVSFANTLKTEYEKELFIHDYICENTVYLYKSRTVNYYSSFPVDFSSTDEKDMTGTFLNMENYHLHGEMGTVNYEQSDIRKWLNSSKKRISPAPTVVDTNLPTLRSSI